MTDLFVIDYGPMEDLMFWDRFARLLKARGADAPPAVLLLGSGEKTQGLLGGPGVAPRADGRLLPDVDKDPLLERGMREELQSVVARLTDEEVSTVGFCGLDRNLLRFTENPQSDDGRVGSAPAVGERALASVTKWTGRGVIPIVSCLAGTTGDRVLDVHPADVARSVADALMDARVIVVAQRLTADLRGGAEGSALSECLLTDVVAALSEQAPVRRLKGRDQSVHITHPDLGDLRSPPRLNFAR